MDIGCGLGRVARPLLKLLSNNGKYYGYDINKKSVDWCKEMYQEANNFYFEWIDLHSIFYNPKGKMRSGSYKFPLPDNYIDYANLSSVLTHMLPNDARNYILEVSRMLKPGKRCLISYFLLDSLSINSFAERAKKGKWYKIENGYVRNKSTPEEVIVLDECFVKEVYKGAGLIIEEKNYGNWHERKIPTNGYQDVIIGYKPF